MGHLYGQNGSDPIRAIPGLVTKCVRQELGDQGYLGELTSTSTSIPRLRHENRKRRQAGHSDQGGEGSRSSSPGLRYTPAAAKARSLLRRFEQRSVKRRSTRA